MRDAWEALAERRSPHPWATRWLEYGFSHGWVVIAEEVPLIDGSVPYDVFALYTCPISGRVGNRIPAGPNLHDDPRAEVDRLIVLVKR